LEGESVEWVQILNYGMSEMSDFFEGLKRQERHGTTERYDAESMFGLKEEAGTASRRLWYKNSFMNCSDPQTVLG
jgi:hypothetical protein